MNRLHNADRSGIDPQSTESPCKVLHIITGDLYAGAERVQELLADRLPEFGYDVSFVCLKEGVFQQQLEAGPRETFTVAMRSRVDLVRTVLKVVRRARETHSRIIHTHTPRGALIGSLTAAITGLPLIHHVHSPAMRDTTNAWANRANALVERGSLLRAAALIPVSGSLSRYLDDQGYPAQRIHPVPNGVSASDLCTSCEVDQDLQLGMVALFRPRKGVEVLLRAMSKMIARGQVVRLKAIGAFENSDYERQVKALAERLQLSPYVEWRGFQSDVLKELTAVDTLVLPSLFGEGMPMVVLEAMAVGLPIVASAVEGVPEVVRDGQEGLLVSPGDVDGLADALKRLLDDRSFARSMGDAARQRQRTVFSDGAMAERLSGIYDRLLGRRRVPVAAPGDDATLLPAPEAFGNTAARNPVFVVGMNGSGTTMLLDCLGHHSALYGFPRETRLIPHLIAIAPRYGPLTDDANFLRLWRYVTLLAPFRLENNLEPMPLPDGWQQCTRDLAGLLNMLLQSFAAREGKSRWCEKSPQYAQHMLKLSGLFPEARFIHVIRDGRDCAYSFNRRWNRSAELTITRWKLLLRAAHAQSAALGDRYMEVRYEDLTSEPELCMRKICAFIDLPFEPAVLESSRPYLTATGEGTGMQANSGQWRRYFSTQEANRLEQIAGRLLAEQGYTSACPEGDETPGVWRQRGWKLADASRQHLREIRLKLQGRIARPWWSILSRPINAFRQNMENDRQ